MKTEKLLARSQGCYLIAYNVQSSPLQQVVAQMEMSIVLCPEWPVRNWSNGIGCANKVTQKGRPFHISWISWNCEYCNTFLISEVNVQVMLFFSSLLLSLMYVSMQELFFFKRKTLLGRWPHLCHVCCTIVREMGCSKWEKFRRTTDIFIA